MKTYVAGGMVLLSLFLVGAGCSSAGEVTSSASETVETNAVVDAGTSSFTFAGILDSTQLMNKQIRITTAKGDIVIKLFPETAPKTVSNFISLAEKGFYNGLTFHRREEGFVIQGGDPNGNGTGGPGYTFEDELTDDKTYDRGIVAMANRGPNTNGSQFFIMLDDVNLPKLYSIFGEVTEGMDIVDQIVIGDAMTTVVIEDVPVEPVVSAEPEVAGEESPSAEVTE
ncbi:MAG: peptidylprolyl isomerase [Patescibacteria group bacterium]